MCTYKGVTPRLTRMSVARRNHVRLVRGVTLYMYGWDMSLSGMILVYPSKQSLVEVKAAHELSSIVDGAALVAVPEYPFFVHKSGPR